MAEESDPLAAATTHLGKVQALLSSEAERLAAEREKMEEDFPKLQLFTEDCISLNVGGHIFMTTLQTLRKDSNSMLASMFSGRFSMKPRKDGTFFIDRDPTHFRFILNFLRTGRIIVPPDEMTREELLLEAEFYNVKPIIDKLNDLQSPFPDSTLMNTEDKRVLVSWLNGKTNWRLIYKASRDGFRAADFHRCCDYKGETISVIHTTGGYLFGGYTDVPWTSAGGQYKQSSQSFLFAFRSSALGNSPAKATIANNNHAVYHHASYCCIFGGGHTICIADSSNTNTSSSSNWSNGQYHSFPPGVTSNNYWLVGQQNFQTQDIEVFGH